MAEAINDLTVLASEPGDVSRASGASGAAGTSGPSGPVRVSKARQKNWLVVLILLLCFVSSVLIMLLVAYGFEPSDTLMWLMVSVLVYLWCRYDAAERGRRIGLGLSFTIVMALMIGFPWYLIRVRRYPMGHAISLTFFWMLICVGVSFAGYYSTFWVLDQIYY